MAEETGKVKFHFEQNARGMDFSKSTLKLLDEHKMRIMSI